MDLTLKKGHVKFCGNDLTLIFRLDLASGQFLTMFNFLNKHSIIFSYFLLQYILRFFCAKKLLKERKGREVLVSLRPELNGRILMSVISFLKPQEVNCLKAKLEVSCSETAPFTHCDSYG